MGYDRHGRKFWFINRRIFVEDEENGEIWYYSTMTQFKDLLSKLDENNMERILCAEIADYSEEIERQMTITESLTNKFKGHKKSYLEIANQNIVDRIKKQKERDEKSDESDTENNMNVVKSEKKHDDNNIGIQDKVKEAEEELNEQTPSRLVSQNVVSTRLKTGSLTPRNYNTDDLKRKTSNRDENECETRITRLKNSNINAPFKLGQEQTFKSYVNQYTTNVYALNKPQRNEDRDKKRPLSHKFSLTQASEFKWSGILNGNRTNAIHTLRQTIISLEQSIPTPFMHSNWSALRKLWLQSISHCSKPFEFAKVLVIFQICTKNCIYVNAWHEQLAHINLERVTLVERDEKKKLEKREKRERDDEEERNRLSINFVKYPLGQRHQVAKQKGEEYRIHGQWSWIWVSYGRRVPKYKTLKNYRIVSAHVVTKIKHNHSEKVVMLEPETYEYLKTQNFSNNSINIPTELHKTSILPVIDSFDYLNISGALATENRLLYPRIAKKSVLDDLLKRRLQLKTEEEQRIEHAALKRTEHISTAATTNKPRGRKPTDIEKQLRRLCGIKSNNTSSVSSSVPISNSNQSQNTDNDFVNEVAHAIIRARDKFAQLNRLGKQYKCYSTCEANDACYSLQQMKKNVCYSPLCLQKTRIKEELLISLKMSASHGDTMKEKIMKIVNRKPENKHNSVQDSNGESSGEISPIKLQRNFLHALEKSCISNFEKDIKSYITIPEFEQQLKKESTCKTEVDSETDNDNFHKDTNHLGGATKLNFLTAGIQQDEPNDPADDSGQECSKR